MSLPMDLLMTDLLALLIVGWAAWVVVRLIRARLPSATAGAVQGKACGGCHQCADRARSD
jgi:hypothetical protein